MNFYEMVQATKRVFWDCIPKITGRAAATVEPCKEETKVKEVVDPYQSATTKAKSEDSNAKTNEAKQPSLIESACKACDDYLVKPLSSAIKTITDEVPKLCQKGCDFISSSFDSVVKSGSSLFKDASSLLSNCCNWISETCSSAFSSISTSIKDTFSGFIDSVSTVVASVFHTESPTPTEKLAVTAEEDTTTDKENENQDDKEVEEAKQELTTELNKHEQCEAKQAQRIQELIKTKQRTRHITRLLPAERSLRFIKNKIQSRTSSVLHKIAELDPKALDWRSLQIITSQLAEINQLSADFNSQKSSFEQESHDHNRVASDLKNYQDYRVSYNGWA